MNGIARIRHILKQTQAEFAQSLSVSRSAVAMWEKGGQEPSFDVLKKISSTLNLPVDYILMIGPFHEWDKILTYYSAVIDEIALRIPHTLFVPFCSVNMPFSDWLRDMSSAGNLDEFQTARWFSYAIRFIAIDESHKNTPHFVDMEFTTEFKALVQKAEEDAINGPVSTNEDGFEKRAYDLIQAARRLSRERQALLLATLEAVVHAFQNSSQETELTTQHPVDVPVAISTAIPVTVHNNS